MFVNDAHLANEFRSIIDIELLKLTRFNELHSLNAYCFIFINDCGIVNSVNDEHLLNAFQRSASIKTFFIYFIQ